MTINSKAKGKQGELEVAALLREHGFEARRGQQFAGGGDSPDVVSNLPGVHLEVKRTERFLLWDAVAQAERDARAGAMPVVIHRMSRKPWVVVMRAEDFLTLMKERAGGSGVATADGARVADVQPSLRRRGTVGRVSGGAGVAPLLGEADEGVGA